MASPYVAVLDQVSNLIIEVFDKILTQVRSRRDQLLTLVGRMRSVIDIRSASMMENLRGLEEMRTQLRGVIVTHSMAVMRQRESLADLDSDIEKLKVGLKNNSNLKFNCSLNQLIHQINQFGEITNVSYIVSRYQTKLRAVKVISDNLPSKSSNKLHIDMVLGIIDYR